MTYSSAVGIDVSKSSLDVSILKQDKCYHKKFSNSIKGINAIESFLIKHSIDDKAQIVLESTGDYHLLPAFTLNKRFNVKVINPLLAKEDKKRRIRKVKTDKVDSKHLAELGQKENLESHAFTISELKKKKLVVLIDTLEKHISSLKLAVKNLERTLNNFGEHLSIISSINDSITSLEKDKAQAQLTLEKFVKSKKLIEDIAQTKGITKHTATKVIAMIEDRHFTNKRSLVAFAGLDVEIKESGKWKGIGKLTKRGTPQLRKYLIQIGWGLLMHNENFQNYLAVHKQKGRKYLELLVIAARKFLKMLYGSIKNNTKFNINLV